MNTFVFFLALACSWVALRSGADNLMIVAEDQKDENNRVSFEIAFAVASVLMWTWYHWLQN